VIGAVWWGHTQYDGLVASLGLRGRLACSGLWHKGKRRRSR
jgi:hypothetical protein